MRVAVRVLHSCAFIIMVDIIIPAMHDMYCIHRNHNLNELQYSYSVLHD